MTIIKLHPALREHYLSHREQYEHEYSGKVISLKYDEGQIKTKLFESAEYDRWQLAMREELARGLAFIPLREDNRILTTLFVRVPPRGPWDGYNLIARER